MIRASATALAAVCFAFGTLACGKVDGSGEGGSGGGGKVDGSGEGGSGGGSTFESAVPPYVAGTRLTPRFLDAGDGARVLFDFVDHELGTSCSFYPTPTGTFRCLPQTPIDCASAYYGACGTPAFATVFDDNHCTGRIATGAARAPDGSPAQHPLHDVRSRNCETGVGYIGAWQGATEVPLEEFVGAQLTSVALGGDLAVEQLVADDGSAVTIGFSRKGNACNPERVGDELRCIDTNKAFLGLDFGGELFAGAACSGDRVGEYDGYECGGPTPGLASSATQFGETCPGDALHFEVIEEASAVSVLSPGNPCLDGYESLSKLARIGAEVPSSALPVLESVQVGSGRLRAVVLTGAGATLGSSSMRSRLHDRTFFDTQLGIVCTAQVTADEVIRCIPGVESYRYAAGCSEIVLPGDTETCAGPIDNRFAPHGVINACGGGFVTGEVWERGAAIAGPAYGLSINGECGAGNDDAVWFSIGATHPLEAFAELSLTEG